MMRQVKRRSHHGVSTTDGNGYGRVIASIQYASCWGIKKYNMEKVQKLELMDKILRELEDLQNSQTSVLKKVAQIEAHNITLGLDVLDKRLPDLTEEVNSSLEIVSSVVEEFTAYREKFFADNNMAAALDPTA